MGMDVYGRNATTKEGEYFRRNVWGWHPLAEFCQAIAPELCAKFEHWHSNDGDGFDNQEDCNALADAIELELKNEGPHYQTLCKAYGASRDTKSSVQEWVTFLRGCGGFEIN